MEHQSSSYSMRIGNTTFIVCLKQSETAKKPIESVFRDLCIHETMCDWFATEQFNLGKMQKSS